MFREYFCCILEILEMHGCGLVAILLFKEMKGSCDWHQMMLLLFVCSLLQSLGLIDAGNISFHF